VTDRWKTLQKSGNFILGERPGVLGKIYPQINVLTVQRILTSIKPIDSAKEAEECGNIKMVSNIIKGKQLGNFRRRLPQQ
jgi:hypothetical protein